MDAMPPPLPITKETMVNAVPGTQLHLVDPDSLSLNLLGEASEGDGMVGRNGEWVGGARRGGVGRGDEGQCSARTATRWLSRLLRTPGTHVWQGVREGTQTRNKRNKPV